MIQSHIPCTMWQVINGRVDNVAPVYSAISVKPAAAI